MSDCKEKHPLLTKSGSEEVDWLHNDTPVSTMKFGWLCVVPFFCVVGVFFRTYSTPQASTTLKVCTMLLEPTYSKGKWVPATSKRNGRSEVTNLHLSYSVVDGARSNVKGFADFDWISSECRLRPFQNETICDILSGKHLLFLGDSITFRHGISFVKQIAPDGDVEPKWPTDTVSICGVKISVVANDHLQKDRCHDDRCYPFWEMIPDVDIIVMNTGAHWRNIESKLKNLRLLDAYLETIGWDGIALYRPSPPGHPGCSVGHKKNPLSLEEALNYSYAHPSHPEYHWEEYEKQNEDILEWLKMKATTYTHIVDIINMTKMRTDGHGPGNGDCLHYVLPSVYDTWSLIVYNFLVEILAESHLSGETDRFPSTM